MSNLSNIKEKEIYYKQNIPYYKGMPCFAGGLRLNSHPYIDNDGFYLHITGEMVDFGAVECQSYILIYLHSVMNF